MIKATHSIHIKRPAHEVFAFLRDNENRIYWQNNLVDQEHERLEKGSRITETRNVLGRRIDINGEVTEFEADRRLTFVGKGPHVKRIEYHYRLHDEDGGTNFTTEIDIELADMFGMTEPIIQRLTDREIDHYNHVLKDLLEHPDVHEAAKTLPRHAHHMKKQ